MDIQEKLQLMLDQQIFGAIELKDQRQIIGTVDAIDLSQITFLDHSPNEIQPLITAAMEDIAAVHIPEMSCQEEADPKV
ncbi:hypothetical protein [Ammoniphilus sp. YIM 78166]|uniref:hypothetical protein n=1 Tax=Ammoniphilus sp. YIM 78166 TaxID=1644106 RepID=UPI00106FBD43|nr:hypothetical protein [Ammoniphilus sp. YIM 78166]